MRQLSARTTEKAIHSLLTKLGRHLEGEWFRLNFSALNFIELLKSSEDVQTFMSDYRRFSFVRDNVKKELDSFERRSSQYFSWIEASIKEDKESFTFALSPILDYLIEDFAHYKAIDNQQAALLEQQIEQLLKENISEVAAAYWMASVRTGMTEFERIRLEWITD